MFACTLEHVQPPPPCLLSLLQLPAQNSMLCYAQLLGWRKDQKLVTLHFQQSTQGDAKTEFRSLVEFKGQLMQKAFQTTVRGKKKTEDRKNKEQSGWPLAGREEGSEVFQALCRWDKEDCGPRGCNYKLLQVDERRTVSSDGGGKNWWCMFLLIQESRRKVFKLIVNATVSMLQRNDVIT